MLATTNAASESSPPLRLDSRPGAGRAPMAAQAPSMSEKPSSSTNTPLNLTSPRLEKRSMYSGNAQHTATRKAVATDAVNRARACC